MSTVETNTVGRMSALCEEIAADRNRSHGRAELFSNLLTVYKWFTIAMSGVSVILGLVASVWKQVKVDPAVFSAIAAVTAGLAGLRQKLSWREQADAYYARRDILDRLLSRIKYQIPVPPTADEVAEIAREYDRVREVVGKMLHEINVHEDAKWNAAGSKTAKP